MAQTASSSPSAPPYPLSYQREDAQLLERARADGVAFEPRLRPTNNAAALARWIFSSDAVAVSPTVLAATCIMLLSLVSLFFFLSPSTYSHIPSINAAFFTDAPQLPTSPHPEIHLALEKLRANLQGTVYFPTDADFVTAARVWSTSSCANTQAPYVVIEAETEADVQKSIQLLSRLKSSYNFPFRIRSGGHNKAGHSTIARGAVLSLKRMNHLELDKQRSLVRMGPAVLVDQFLEHVLGRHGYGGVVGYCGTVAEAGFVLGGGIGMQSRLYGLGSDNILGMKIVLPNGHVRHVSRNSTDRLDQDLFWALRGAGGGNFGVVTELEYRVHKASNRVRFASLKLSSPLHMAMFLSRLGQHEAALPGNLMVMHDLIGTARLSWSGSNDEGVANATNFFDSLLQELLPPHVPRILHQEEHVWSDFFLSFKSLHSNVHAAHCWYGFLYPENNTLQVWNDILQHIWPAVHELDGLLLPDIELWGGAIHDMPWNATPFPHRSAVFNVGVLLTVPSDQHNATSILEETAAQVNAWWPQVAKYLTGSYVNYPTTSLLPRDYARVYWGDNLPRLVDIKKRVDPRNSFAFPMSVPLELP